YVPRDLPAADDRRAAAHTRCPYTTLFRSCAAAFLLPGGGSQRRQRPAAGAADVLAPVLHHILGHLAAKIAAAQRAVFAQDDAVGDRKSTRLNSSHVSSSYAVFCLKKQPRV